MYHGPISRRPVLTAARGVAPLGAKREVVVEHDRLPVEHVDVDMPGLGVEPVDQGVERVHELQAEALEGWYHSR